MTNGLKIFLALYILAGQPALLGWMLENGNLYQLAGLNAGVFLIAWIISAILKPSPKKTASQAIASELLGEDVDTDGNGVSVLKVQETTVKEIEVAKVGTTEDKIEDKSDELKNALQKEEKSEKSDEKPAKNSGKTMREGVSTPKIVQPIGGYTYNAKRKKKKETKRGQRLVRLLGTAIAGVTAWTLWEFLGKRGVALSLILGWLLYVIIGKLFDVNGFHKVKKLITNRLFILMILGGIGYGAYSMTQSDSNVSNDGRNKAVSYIKDWFKSDDVDENEIYVFEGTGEVISNAESDSVLSGDENNAELSGDISTGAELSSNESTGNEVINTMGATGTLTSQPQNTNPEPTEIKVEENQAPSLSAEEANKSVTMGEAVKSLLAGATLSTKTNVTFKYVAKSNELYPYFKTAQEKAMLGTDADPSKIVSCDTYITLKGLREGRNVGSYTSKNVKSVYWNKAAELGKLNGCEKGKYVKRGNL